MGALCCNEPCEILTKLKPNKGTFELILALSIGDDMVQCANCERNINVSVEYFNIDKLNHIKIQCVANTNVHSIHFYNNNFCAVFCIYVHYGEWVRV